MSPQEWLATQQTAPAASAPLSPEQWLATQKPATNAAEGPPSATVPFVPVSSNIMAQGKRMRNRLPVTPAPLVAPAVVQPIEEPTEKELAIASEPYRFQVPTRRVVPVAPQVERPVEPPPTESELAIAQKRATVNTIIDRQGKVIRGDSVNAPIVLPVPEEQSVARQFADVPLQLTKGTVSGVRSITDFFGADSETSKVLRSSEDYLGKLMSAQSQNNSKEIARIKKEVEDKGIEAQIGGAIRALGVAPVDTLVNAFGTAAPALVAGLATAFFGAPAAVATGVGVGIGAMMGAGTIKGTIYEETKKALIEAGVNPEIADKTAQEAQKYNGKNLDNILLGGGLGAFASKTGIESVLIKGMVNKILARSATADSAKILAKDYAKNNFVTITKKLAEAGIYEGAPEFLQAFQEAVASNIAQQREGLVDVPTFRGAVFAGVLEGLAGNVLGSAVKGVELSKDATLSPSQKIGKALQQDIAEKGYTQEGSRREALARLNPDQAQYLSTAAPAARPQPPQGRVTAAPIAPAVVAAEPKTEAAQVVPAAGEAAPEEQRVVPKGLLAPSDFEAPAIDDLEDPSVTGVTLEGSSNETKTAAPDDLYNKAVEIVRTTDRASPSLVQRQLNIRFDEAIALIEEMERNGVVSPADASGSRTVIETTPAATTAARQTLAEVTVKGRGLVINGPAKVDAPNESLPMEEQDLLRNMVDIEIRNGVAKGRTDEEILQRIESLTKGGIKTISIVLLTIEDARKAFKAETVERIEEKPPVTGFVARGKAAMDSFESSVMEQFGLTQEQARAALGKLIAEKIVKINPLTGSFDLKDGRFWDKEVMLRAAGVKPEEVAEVVEKKTPAPILQNRDRSSDASINQMQGIAADPDYGRLGFSRDFANGAPVIAGGNIPIEQLGRKDFAVTATGRRIPIQYAVVDANSILASNFIDGTVNKDYNDSSIKQPRAIAGNGRKEGIQEAYKAGTADKYKSELIQDRMHGVSLEVVARIPNRMTVRIMSESDITSDIGDVSNIRTGLGLSAVAQAKNDINRVDLNALEFNDDGDVTANAVRQFIRGMPETELEELMDKKGVPSKLAYARLEAAIFAKAYNNDRLIGLFSQANNAEGKLLLSALAQVAPQMSRLEGAGILDIRDIVTDGAIAILNARSRGLNLKEAAIQSDIEMSPDAQIIVALFAANPRSNKAAIVALRNAANLAYKTAFEPSTDMFGTGATREDVLNKIRDGYERPIAQDVATTEGTGAVQANAEGATPQPSATGIPGKNEKGGTGEAKPEELILTGETEAQIRKRERKAKEAKAAEEKAAAEVEAKEKKERDKKAIAEASKKADFSLTPSEEVSKAEQAEIDKKKAEQELSRQSDMLDGEKKTDEVKTEEREPVKGDRFKDGKGNEFEVWSSRQGSVLAHPVVNGKPVVNRDSLQLWAIGDVARARFPERRTDYFSIDATKPTETTAQTEESDNKKVDAALEKLNDKEVEKLEDHYGYKKNTDGFATKLRADIQRAIEKGINAVAKGIRNVIKKLLATILAVGVAFNPVTFNAESQAFNIPSIQTTELVKIVEKPKANFGAIIPSVTTARLAHYVVGTNDNEGLPFIITDKPIATSYVFDAKGNLVAAAPVLLGAAKDKDVIPRSAIEKTVAQTTKEEKVTPAGRFKGKIERRKSGTSFDFIKLGNSSLVGHIAYTGNPAENRLKRLSTPTADDNFISYGCINYGEKFYNDHIEKQFADGGIQYITPMSQTLEQTFEGIAGYQPTTTVVTSIVSNPQSAFNVSKHSEQGVLRSPRTNVTLPSRRRQEGKPGEAGAKDAGTNLIGDKRLSEQPADVREALAAGFRGTTDDAVLWEDMFLNLVDEDVTGQELLDVMSNRNDERQVDPVELSMAISALYSIGLDGIIDEDGGRTSFIPKEYDLKNESDITDKIAAANPAESKALNEMDQLPTAKKKLPPGRSPELAAAAQMVKDGTMTTAQFDSLVNKYKPIYIFTDPLVPATIEKMVDALTSTQGKQVNPKITNGTAVGLRLDIPSFNRKGVHVVSIHEKGTKSGSGRIIGYSSSAKAINVKFSPGNQSAALNIAAGEAKKPLQTIEGSYVSTTPEQIYEQAKLALIDPAWTQIGLNPTRHSYFYDRRTTVPVIAADEVLQIGNMVLGKNVTFGKKEDFLFNIDSQPPLSAGELAQRNTDIRREQINEYAGLRRRMASAVRKVAEGEVSTDLQRSLSSLMGRSSYLKTAIDISTPTSTSPETFLAKALSEYDAGNISADVLAVAQVAYNKYPQLLDGIRLSVRSHGKDSNNRAAAMFVPLARIVRLFKSTTGATDPKSIRHELNHSLEQMMSGAQRQVVFDAWLKDLQKASEKNQDELHQKFFNAVLNFIENPSLANHEKAMAALPGYEMYQYVNPSEYWAVNAEKLMASQLGTAWQRFKLFVQRMFEGLKSVFGFDNKYAVQKVFNQIMSGEMNRISRSQLVDMVTGDKDFVALNNLQDDMDLLERYGHAHTPVSGTSSLKKAVLTATTTAKQIFKKGVEDPKSLAIDAITTADRATIYMRNKNVWFGTGLDAAEYSAFNGQMRDANGLVNASIALDNAIRATAISSQVVLNGGIKYDPNSLSYVAEKRDKGMVGVYKAESLIKKKLGNQLGTDIIQGYLEAKRSLSIRNELVARQDQLNQLAADLITLKSNPNADPDDISALKMEISEAKKALTAIELVERKVSMSNGEIRDFLSRARAHPELGDIMTNYNAVNQNLLVFWRDVGLISEARYELLSNIKDYIPWYRIMEDGTISADTDEAGSALQSTTRSMTNIGREKLFKAGRPSVSTRFKAKQGQQTFKIQPSRVVGVEINENPINPNDVRSAPNGEVTINVPINEGDIVEFKTNREIQNMVDNMTRSVMRMTMNGLRKNAANHIVDRYATRNLNGQLTVFPKVDKDKGRFTHISNGRNIVVEIEDKLIAEAVFGMENLDIKMLYGFNYLANFTRRLITIDPEFQLKQLLMDAPVAAWASGTKHWYKLLGGVYKNFVYTLVRPVANKVGVTLTGNQNFDIEPVARTLQLAGIGGYHIPSRTAEKEVKMQVGIMNRNAFQFILKALDHIGDSSDVAPRIATYKRVLAETGDEALALYRAANVINFHHRGSGQVAQILVKTVPFISAYANATDVMAQTLAGGGLKGKSRKAAFAQMAITGTSLGILTLLLRCAIGDDDEYKKYDDKTRYGNYIIPGTNIMLPMHNSGAFFFKVLPEFLYDKYIEESTATPKDATRLKEALKTAAIDMLLGPTPVPSGARPVIEIGINRSFLTGRPVVPVGLNGVEAAEQYTATTSELGKYVSSATRGALNPIQADHIIRGFFGSVGSLAQWASNLIGEAAEKRPAMTDKQNPFYGAFVKPVQRGPEDLFYDFKERVDEKYKTMELQIDRQNVKGVLSNVEENKRLIAMHDYVDNTNKELSRINKIIREISEGQMNPMSPQEKRKTIELLQRAKNSTLTGVEKMRSISGL